jgi:outer membrane receptor protein involved in Fe transport
MKRLIRMLPFCVLATAVFLFAANSALGQVSTATLSGTVVDQQKAAVAGATVTAKESATGLERSAQTNSDGSYTITNLPAGKYNVAVEAKGFARSIVKDLALEVGRVADADFTLSVAGTAEKVVVSEEVVGVDTTQSTIEGVVNERSIDDLPLNGRNFTELTFLLPGNVLAPSFDPTKARSVEVSSLGNLGRGTNTTVDGVEDNDSQIGGVSQNYTEESIQEFQVVTGRFSAEFGRAGFNALNIVSKSGTNEFHGGGFLFFRDDALQAKGPFGGPVKAPFDREQFGGSVGGPIIKDKAFFFFALERNREQGATTGGSRNTVTGVVTQSFASTPFREYLLTAKGDLLVTSKDRVSMRYSLQRNNDTDPGTSRNGLLQDPSNFESQLNHFYQGVASWTRTLSNTMVNDLRVNFLFTENRIQPLTTSPQIVFPSINVGANFRADQGNIQHRTQVKDDLSLVSGRHTFKFGADYSHLSLPEPTNFNLFGPGLIFVTCGDFAAQCGVANDSQIPVAFSLINTQTLTQGFPGFGIRGAIPATGDDTLGLYLQDDWKFRPNLTFNLGLRWEYDNDFIGKHQVNQFAPGKRTVDKADFGPRVGFAWDPTHNGKTSVRGGYGLYFDHNVIETRQLELLVDGVRLPIAVSAGGGCTLANPFCSVLPGQAPSIQATANNLRQPFVHQWAIGFQRELWKDWVVTADYIGTRGRHFQRQVEVNRLPSGTPCPASPGPATPRVNCAFDSVIETQTIANTQFDGLLATVNKRFTNHFQFLASYTLSRSLNEDNDLLGFISASSNPSNHGIDFGPSPNDSRHRLVLSGVFDLPFGVEFAPILTTFSSVPLNITQNADFSGIVGDGFFRLPGLERNGGNRQVQTGADVNALINVFNANPANVGPTSLRGSNGFGCSANNTPINTGSSKNPSNGLICTVNPKLDFGHPFFTLDFRLVKRFTWKERYHVDIGWEAFNIFNHINILGIANTNYAGLQGNVESSNFGKPLGVTPGGVFGTGGPRAFQLVSRFRF